MQVHSFFVLRKFEGFLKGTKALKSASATMQSNHSYRLLMNCFLTRLSTLLQRWECQCGFFQSTLLPFLSAPKTYGHWSGCICLCISTVAAIRISDRFCSQLLENVCTQTEAQSSELISTSVMMLLAPFHENLIFNFQSDGFCCTRSHRCLHAICSHDCTWDPRIPSATDLPRL